MERPRCKLCFRTFANGRALGGHMKAHLASLKIHRTHVAESITSYPSSSSPEEEEEEEEESRGDQEIEEKSLIYGLRENPRRSVKCADPEFSFSGGSGFAVVQDRESETESRNPTRRRSKRTRRKLGGCDDNAEDEKQRKQKLKPSQPSSPAEPEPVSSVSDTSPEEDVAMCLMLLSRDKWRRKRRDGDDHDREEVEEGQKGNLMGNEAERKHHQCEVCKKVFRSSQALGGHRVIHRKSVGLMGCDKKRQEDERERRDGGWSKEMVMARKKERVYECPFCGRVFGNGQALGGHKRSHMMGLGGSSVGGNGDGAQSSRSKVSANLLDLNLPAPAEEDNFSVVSDDGEFTQPIKN
ncbi:hypothetical protein ACJRO7_018566 [Eucalyptus globulus]|uniref:C2H2-type domain-containing protein n=1 Tax=Eucalyptus globulus TaxID=34317 RepID=A0ABD3KV34_EUCGL